MEKEDDKITKARRALLRAEIKRLGLSTIAKMAGKPDRQINDMTKKKSFGDKIAREIGPLIRPDLAPDWLLSPDLSVLEKPEGEYDQPKDSGLKVIKDHGAKDEYTEVARGPDEVEILKGFRAANSDTKASMLFQARLSLKTAVGAA